MLNKLINRSYLLDPSHQSQVPSHPNKYTRHGLTDSLRAIFAITERVRTKFYKTLDFSNHIVYDDVKAKVRRP